MIFAITPPTVSIPNESGATSIKIDSSPFFIVSDNTAAWIAAPCAIASSGSFFN
jgi:hypothetical protein